MTTPKEVTNAASLASLLLSEADEYPLDSAEWKARVLAAEELRGWLYVVGTGRKPRRNLSDVIHSATAIFANHSVRPPAVLSISTDLSAT